jgi:formylglycine-generating enzyme required for sulfatase activity
MRACAGIITVLTLILGAACSGDAPPEDRGPYAEETLRRFHEIVDGAGWAEPSWNASGTLETIHEKTGLTFVLIPAGEFMMGTEGGSDDEGPRHRVTVPAFLLCKTECSQRAWDAVGGEDEREFSAGALPISSANWNDVRAWCAKSGFRLPSESEWEYACRSGASGKWCCEDEEPRLAGYAWYFVNSGVKRLPWDTKWDDARANGKWGCRTHPTGELKPNAFGLHDMHGNVNEWCEDAWHDDYEGAPDDGTAWAGEDTELRVIRGGSWKYRADFTRSAYRYWNTHDARWKLVGFRPARSLGPEL